MRRIKISNQKGITGWVYPEYGGMLGRLILNGKEIFALDEDRLALSPLLAGGNPVLFPFPSKTENDTYKIDEAQYHMPFHGLVMNAAFLLEETCQDSVTLSIRNSPSWRESSFPFEFLLRLSYNITENGVRLKTSVTNHSQHAMPHGFGWHCYFTASDKTSIDLHVPMKQYIDYTDGTIKQDEKPNLNMAADYVFYDRKDGQITFDNRADGYCVEMTLDEAFQVVTVCTLFDGRLCVEPWMGLPDSANTGRFLQWVPPQQTRVYETAIRLSEIGR